MQVGCGRQGTKKGKCRKCDSVDDAESHSDEVEGLEGRLQADVRAQGGAAGMEVLERSEVHRAR